MTLPPAPDSFRWTEESWGAALRCLPLEAIAPHLFTTRQLELSGDGYAAIARALGVPGVATVNQVHGREVVAVPEGESLPRIHADADALVSNRPDTAIVVRAADCVPILLADQRTGAVAAVHAGWRGTAAGVLPAAIAVLQRQFDAKPEHLVAAIGPAIGPCCYEVGTELVDAFASAGHERYLIDRWFHAPPPRQGEPRSARPKLHLDVPGANRDQLILAGVPEDQIYVAGLCTAMHLDVLTSYRAEREHAGRMAAAIVRYAAQP